MAQWIASRVVLVAITGVVACAEPEDDPEQTGPGITGTPTTTVGTESSADTAAACLPECVAPSVCNGGVCVPPGGTMADTTSTAGDDTTDGDPMFDVGVELDVAPGEECIPCEIALMTTQSNAMHATAGMPLFVEAQLDGHLVFGMAEADAGRLAFSGDGNVIYREGTCPLWPWLGATGDQLPRVLCFGAKWPCDGETEGMPPLEINALHSYAGTLDYGGITLPEPYASDPTALRSDYDLVVYISVHDYETGSWDFVPGDAATLESFVRDEGGGLYLVGEYWGAMEATHVASLNAMAAPYDIAFEQLSLDWGPAGATVEIDCFPEPAG